MVDNGTGEDKHIDPMHGTAAPNVMSNDAIENNTDSKSDDEAADSHDISSQILDYINSPGSTSALGNHEDGTEAKEADRDSGTGQFIY